MMTNQEFATRPSQMSRDSKSKYNDMRKDVMSLWEDDPQGIWHIQEIVDKLDLKPSDILVREVIWSLIGDDELEFTPQRQFKKKSS